MIDMTETTTTTTENINIIRGTLVSLCRVCRVLKHENCSDLEVQTRTIISRDYQKSFEHGNCNECVCTYGQSVVSTVSSVS